MVLMKDYIAIILKRKNISKNLTMDIWICLKDEQDQGTSGFVQVIGIRRLHRGERER